MRNSYDQVDIEIIVEPRGHGRFAAHQGGRLLVVSSEPLLAAARILLAEGWPRGAVIGMRHQGAPDIALRGRIGVAAKLTVRENDHTGPEFRRWEASPFRRVAPPVRLIGEAAE